MNGKDRTLRAVLCASAIGAAALLSGCVAVHSSTTASEARVDAPIKTVYHLTLGLDEAQRAMGNVRNHLAADPSAKIIVVSNGDGILFQLDGAKDRNGNPFDAAIQDLKSRGVEFRVCNNTLVQRKIDRGRVIPDVAIVPSGVAEAARLQAREGFVYLRP
ncbi:MAG: DsrE family protein [Burkholderiales bacterium]|nr:DsrE family protein [Burkholderiales bacterium]